MIHSFRDAPTAELFLTGKSRKFPTDIWKSGQRRLRLLNAAETLADLRSEGLKLESYGGTRKSIRVNDRYRILFDWIEGNAFEVILTDPH